MVMSSNVRPSVSASQMALSVWIPTVSSQRFTRPLNACNGHPAFPNGGNNVVPINEAFGQSKLYYDDWLKVINTQSDQVGRSLAEGFGFGNFLSCAQLGQRKGTT